MKLHKLEIDDELKRHLPMFYHFIYYNELEPGDPFTRAEFSEHTQSLVFFQPPEKLISKVVDMEILWKDKPVS